MEQIIEMIAEQIAEKVADKVIAKMTENGIMPMNAPETEKVEAMPNIANLMGGDGIASILGAFMGMGK